MSVGETVACRRKPGREYPALISLRPSSVLSWLPVGRRVQDPTGVNHVSSLPQQGIAGESVRTLWGGGGKWRRSSAVIECLLVILP